MNMVSCDVNHVEPGSVQSPLPWSFPRCEKKKKKNLSRSS